MTHFILLDISSLLMNFAQRVIHYHDSIDPNWKLPRGIELIYPFRDVEAQKVFSIFYRKYFSDKKKRTFLFGINPGRFGAGITGVPFTDPKILEEICGIQNTFQKRNELSALFIYEMIDKLGGPTVFYSHFYITSVCHLGFIKDNKNINYYDDSKLESEVREKIINNISTQIQFGAQREVAYSIGQGKNYKFLSKLNKEHQFFDRIEPLPHPRWVLQYRRKTKDIYLGQYLSAMEEHSG